QKTVGTSCGSMTLSGKCNGTGGAAISCTANNATAYLTVVTCWGTTGGTGTTAPTSTTMTCNFSCSPSTFCPFGPSSLTGSKPVTAYAPGGTICTVPPCSGGGGGGG